MVALSDRLTDLILGEQWSRTRRALVLTAAFVIATTISEYALFLTKFEKGWIETLHEVFFLDGYLPSWHATGAFFVIGLAALHSYLNEGYLPSVLLGWSPAFGNLSWTFRRLSGVEQYYYDPVAAFERTFPEAVVLATLGFVFGVGLRSIRKRHRNYAASQSEPDEIRSAK